MALSTNNIFCLWNLLSFFSLSFSMHTCFYWLSWENSMLTQTSYMQIWPHISSQFADKFAEYKEAARLAKEKSLEKMELASSPSQVGMFSFVKISACLGLLTHFITACFIYLFSLIPSRVTFPFLRFQSKTTPWGLALVQVGLINSFVMLFS